jgi:hypothetical protein
VDTRFIEPVLTLNVHLRRGLEFVQEVERNVSAEDEEPEAYSWDDEHFEIRLEDHDRSLHSARPVRGQWRGQPIEENDDASGVESSSALESKEMAEHGSVIAGCGLETKADHSTPRMVAGAWVQAYSGVIAPRLW